LYSCQQLTHDGNPLQPLARRAKELGYALKKMEPKLKTDGEIVAAK
jgi:hypothetical protein